MTQSPMTGQHWTVDVAGLAIELPIVAIKPDFAISLMMVIDLGVRFGAHAGAALAHKLAPLRPDIIVGPATLGIPVAIETTRALNLDRYVVLQKSPKIHLGDALVQTISSITSTREQQLLLAGRGDGGDRLHQRIAEMDLGRFLQHDIPVEVQCPRRLDGHGNAECGRPDDDVRAQRRQFVRKRRARMGAETDAEIDDHHERDGEVRFDGDDRKFDGKAGDIDRPVLAGHG